MSLNKKIDGTLYCLVQNRHDEYLLVKQLSVLYPSGAVLYNTVDHERIDPDEPTTEAARRIIERNEHLLTVPNPEREKLKRQVAQDIKDAARRFCWPTD